MKLAANIIVRAGAIGLLPLIVAGCAQLSVQGGEKPIHMIVDVNIKVDRELDQFFAFENQMKAPTTQPGATQPATTQSITSENSARSSS
jgi:hypothetical protein